MKAEFAWPGGDRPKDLLFNNEVPENIKKKIIESISAYISDGVRSISALSPVQGVAGRYAVFGKGKKYFVRISSRIGEPEIEKKITDYLMAEGISINPIKFISKRLKYNDNRYRVDIRKLLTARHFNKSDQDLIKMTSTLACFHKKMVVFPDEEKICVLAKKRYQRLAMIKTQISSAIKNDQYDFFAELKSWAKSYKRWFIDLVDHFQPCFDEDAGAQCLHGELHPGNILFLLEDNSPVLIDFEESIHVYANPIWDFAFLFQRFCLYDNPELSEVIKRFELMVNAYDTSLANFTLPNVLNMIRQIAWSTMTVILDLRQQQGVISPISEYEKFVGFEKQAREYQKQLL